MSSTRVILSLYGRLLPGRYVCTDMMSDLKSDSDVAFFHDMEAQIGYIFARSWGEAKSMLLTPHYRQSDFHDNMICLYLLNGMELEAKWLLNNRTGVTVRSFWIRYMHYLAESCGLALTQYFVRQWGKFHTGGMNRTALITMLQCATLNDRAGLGISRWLIHQYRFLVHHVRPKDKIMWAVTWWCTGQKDVLDGFPDVPIQLIRQIRLCLFDKWILTLEVCGLGFLPTDVLHILCEMMCACPCDVFSRVGLQMGVPELHIRDRSVTDLILNFFDRQSVDIVNFCDSL